MKLPLLSVSAHTQYMIDLQSAYANTHCDWETGATQVNILRPGDYGPDACLFAHENVHANDIGPCCNNVATCVNNANTAAEAVACSQRYATWFGQIKNFTECNAYTQEIACLTNQLTNDNTLTHIQRDKLQMRLMEAVQYQTQYCRLSQGAVPCPINQNGQII